MTKRKARADGAAREVGRVPAKAKQQQQAAVEPIDNSKLDGVDIIELDAPLPPEDPALLAAVALLRRAMAEAGETLETVTAKGTVVVVVAPSDQWAKALSTAWGSRIGDIKRTVHGGQRLSRYSDTATQLFAGDAAPKQFEVDELEKRFADALWRGLNVVGIAANLDWLSKDLIESADVRLTVGLPDDALLRGVATAYTGLAPIEAVEIVYPAWATPRLLRLAARPGQTADAYLAKLGSLLVQVAERAATAPTASLRSEPRLERMFGMAEAVEWGMNLKADLAAYRAGERPWQDVDRGVLLSGPPGTGKTTFARALAATCEVTLFVGSYSSWLANGTAHQGDLLKAMRKSFRDAAASAPSILFIDEVDSFPNREMVGREREWFMEVVNALLAEIDGAEQHEGVVVVGACNHPHRVDPALVRSGRLDRHIRIRLPTRDDLALIFREHLGTDLAHDTLEEIAVLAAGASGADVERYVRGARRRARQADRAMAAVDLLQEVNGPDRSDAEMRLVSIHEAGHAVAAHALGLGFTAVTLRGSGRQSGGVYSAPLPPHPTAADIMERLIYVLAGRAAEQVLLGSVSAGSGGAADSDLGQATMLAAEAAAGLGLEEERHGLLWLPVPDRADEIAQFLADHPALAALVRDRLAEAYGMAVDLIEARRPAVQAVANRLLEKSALEPAEVAHLVTGPWQAAPR